MVSLAFRCQSSEFGSWWNFVRCTCPSLSTCFVSARWCGHHSMQAFGGVSRAVCLRRVYSWKTTRLLGFPDMRDAPGRARGWFKISTGFSATLMAASAMTLLVTSSDVVEARCCPIGQWIIVSVSCPGSRGNTVSYSFAFAQAKGGDRTFLLTPFCTFLCPFLYGSSFPSPASPEVYLGLSPPGSNHFGAMHFHGSHARVTRWI